MDCIMVYKGKIYVRKSQKPELYDRCTGCAFEATNQCMQDNPDCVEMSDGNLKLYIYEEVSSGASDVCS